MGICNCSMFCCTLLYVHSSIAIILMGKRELIVLLNLSSWCLVMVERLFLAVPRGCLQFVIVVFPDHTHYLWIKLFSFRYGEFVNNKGLLKLFFSIGQKSLSDEFHSMFMGELPMLTRPIDMDMGIEWAIA